MTVAEKSVDIVIVGAGPVGLTLANILGQQGVRTLVVDERDNLIDYPRGVGLDDEALRTFQSIGLVDQILRLACRLVDRSLPLETVVVSKLPGGSLAAALQLIHVLGHFRSF